MYPHIVLHLAVLNENQTFLCQFSNLGFCFRYSLDEYGTARRTAVVRGLIDALTRGGEYWVHMVQIKVLKGFIVYAWQKYINFDSNVLSCMLLVQSKFLYHWFPVRVYNSRSLEYVL